MFTAKDIDRIIRKSNECENLDIWIENHLVKQFLQNPDQASVAANVLKINDWTKQGFMDSISARGFSVTFVSDQRDGDFYTITYPPQSL